MFTYDENIFSDLYKDTHGFRPRGHEFFEVATTPERKQEIWDAQIEAFDHEMKYQAEQDAAAIEDYEDSLKILIATGAKDRDQAKRWLIDSLELTEMDLRYGAGYICHTLGLPYSMEGEFEQFVTGAWND